MNNKRHYSRYTIKCNGDITDTRFNNYRFVMNNISAGGMNITTDKELADDMILTIRFDMCDILLPRMKQFKGKVIRKKSHNSVYNYGIRFSDVTNMEIVEIDEYLRFRHFSALAHVVENPHESTYMR